MTLPKGHFSVVCQHFKPPYPLNTKILGEFQFVIQIQFLMQLPGKGEKKVDIFGQGHMTKMAIMPIYSKNLKLDMCLQDTDPPPNALSRMAS